MFQDPLAKRRFIPLVVLAGLIVLLFLIFPEQPIATGTIFALVYLGVAWELLFRLARQRRDGDGVMGPWAREQAFAAVFLAALALVSIIGGVESHYR